MSDKKTGQINLSTNKMIKKLRTISVVCSLTGSWQQWVTENETSRPENVSQRNQIPSSSKQKLHNSMKLLLEKLKRLLTRMPNIHPKLRRESLPSEEEIDRLLKKKSSPTRRRKCCNVVSSLTKSWKQVESEQKLGKEGGGPGEGHTCAGDGHTEAEKETLDTVDAHSHKMNPLKEEEQKPSEGASESAIRIKRPSVPTYKKEDPNKINALSMNYSAVGNLKSRWQNWASEHTVNQKLNPSSEYLDHDYSMSLRLQKGEEGYGRPKEGTKTAERAKRAEQHIHGEISDMCYVIRTLADPDPDRKTRVTFGQLFDRYVRISDKVVGILMRARKLGKVAFEGERLWQGQDIGVVISLMV
ncbi:Actin-binding Rho-activating protein [Dissostichus eleginoides]|uniref:Actin-binding Rho-activating protein n=1 Tax=Dissostichus eleginoides TaxID=100907 RepID=A0AAD9BB95_DISEL|nr:Actin-binding Rho-activating protein [Dissostichus eleginoides]